MSPEHDDLTRDDADGTPITQHDSAPGTLAPEDALALTRALAAEADFLHSPQYWDASAERIEDGCEAVRQLIAIHLRQARRDGRQGRAQRRIYGQDVSGVLRQTNEVNLRLAAAWLAVSLAFLPRAPKRRRPGD